MDENTQHPNALDHTTMTLRQLALAVGGWAVGKGYLGADTLSMMVAVIVIGGPFVVGQIKSLKAIKAGKQ